MKLQIANLERINKDLLLNVKRFDSEQKERQRLEDAVQYQRCLKTRPQSPVKMVCVRINMFLCVATELVERVSVSGEGGL